jgi:uracil-DNA glycosylase
LTPPESTKVIWIGQDPYHNGQATGLCMGIKNPPIPPTLRVLNRSLEVETGSPINDLSLESWAKQGVLLLNASLTVEEKKPNSHVDLWRGFVSELLENILVNINPIWVALGKEAQRRIETLPIPEERLILAPHPMVAIYQSPEAFLKHRIFSQINEKLVANQQQPINFSS